jgi:uncharacterized repeat protein (TIGR03803 family)
MAISGNTLYGTANTLGPHGQGTIFSIQTDGSGFAVLYSFSSLQGPLLTTNSDGANPYAGLALASNTLFGATFAGGADTQGTLYRINTDGSGFTVLHTFTSTSWSGSIGYATNADGAAPYADLLVYSNALYGTTTTGGAYGNGTVFKLRTDGTGFTTLHNFTAPSSFTGPLTNTDGSTPKGKLFLSGGTLYGTTLTAGSFGNGTVFQVQTNGSGFAILHSFAATRSNPLIGDITQTNNGGANPEAGVILSANGILYGTTGNGGLFGNGTLFSVTLPPPPQLTIAAVPASPSGPGPIVVAWPVSSSGLTLQSAGTLSSSSVWTQVPISPVQLNGQNVLTIPLTSNQRFFRLAQ